MENSQDTIGLAAQDAAAAAVQKTPHRVTLEHLEGLVKEEQFINPPSAPLLTLCIVTVENGFVVIGKSAAADPNNFDAELGRKIARSDAIQKLWPLEGYLLRQRLHEGLELNEESVQTAVTVAGDGDGMDTAPAPEPDEPEVAAATAAAPHLSRVSAETPEPAADEDPAEPETPEAEDAPEVAAEAAHDGGPPPSVGRIVHALLAAPGGTQIAPAIITAVREEAKVCLTIFRPMGAQATVDNVEAISNDVSDPALVQNGVLWAWPPRV